MKIVRLRPGVHFAPIDGGVYFSSARATFVVRGPAVLFRVVDTCLPLLEDGTDIDELVDAIGAPSARPLVTHLVDTLDSRGLLLHLDQLLVPEPSEAERDRYPEALAYLETYRDDPYGDFRRVRKARVLLVGSAAALGPAARGLVRAGVGQVLVATTEPERLAGLASRHPAVRLLLCAADGLPVLLAGCLPQAAVIVTEDTFPTEALQRLPAGCIAVPVRLGKDLAIVGPALRRGDDRDAAEGLWARATMWCHRDGDDLLVRPSGDLLAGALAGQVALDALIGLNAGRVHLVHGPDLSSDSIAPVLTTWTEYDEPTEFGTPHEVLPTATEPAQEPEAPNWLDSASARWAGLFRVTVPGDLPQMPVAITLADGRSGCFDGRALGVGPDQGTSTTEAGLEALRQHCSHQFAEHHEVDGPVAAAAGLDETRWLLDGALRLVAHGAVEERQLDWLGIDDPEARRLWRALEEHELTPVNLACCHAPGFGWTLVSVHDRRSGQRLASGWGPSPSVGAVAALSAAIATVQVRRTVDPGLAPGPATPGFLDHLHEPHRDALAAEVRRWLSAMGGRLSGRRLARDPITGPLGAWCGMVRLDA